MPRPRHLLTAIFTQGMLEKFRPTTYRERGVRSERRGSEEGEDEVRRKRRERGGNEERERRK